MIVVFDIGAAYGVHSTWIRPFSARFLQYYAFEPNSNASEILMRKYLQNKNYHLRKIALGNRSTLARIEILNHEGLSSFKSANQDSTWFKQAGSRSNDSKSKRFERVKVKTISEVARKEGVTPQFLKIDTEGSELEILEGAGDVLESVLGIRVEVAFEEIFIGGPRFWDIANFLDSYSFKLVNLDYSGQGIAQSYFVPNMSKYGIISSTDAVFIKERIDCLGEEQLIALAIFCFENSLEDLAVHLIQSIAFSTTSFETEKKFIQLRFLEGAKSLLYQQTTAFEKACKQYCSLFGEAFPERHNYWEKVSQLNKALFT
jgi:FkbM family methyltransferase